MISWVACVTYSRLAFPGQLLGPERSLQTSRASTESQKGRAFLSSEVWATPSSTGFLHLWLIWHVLSNNAIITALYKYRLLTFQMARYVRKLNGKYLLFLLCQIPETNTYFSSMRPRQVTITCPKSLLSSKQKSPFYCRNVDSLWQATVDGTD